MKSGKSLRRARICAVAAAALALSLVNALAASAVPGRPGGGDLSSRLATLATSTVRSGSPGEQADDLDLAANGPGSLLRKGNRVVVEVRFERGVDAVALRAAGAQVLDVNGGIETATAAVKPAELRRLSAVSGVVAVTEVLEPVVHAEGGPGPVTAAAAPCFGGATSEGDVQLKAAQARAEFEVDGTGVEVGVLSDSFDRDASAVTDAATDAESGDLPGLGNPCGRITPVEVLADLEGAEPSDEGRAMAQIVHDLAPGASLSFATAFTGLSAFADNVEALAATGADVIVDDVSYFEEPFFQEGPVGVAVSEVTEEADVVYFSAAGNNNLIVGGNDIASWEAAEYRDSGDCPAAVVVLSEEFEAEGFGGLNPSHCVDFDPTAGVDRTFGITVSKGATLRLDLQWAEPWFGVATDIDVILLDPEGSPVAGSLDDNVGGSQRPFEFISWQNDTGAAATVELAINRFSGGEPRLKLALLQNGGGVSATEYPESGGGDVVGPTIFGHNGAADAMSLGAIRYNAATSPENFSSRGPVTHYFGPVDGSAPAEPLGAPPSLAKPDVVATDGGANSFFGGCIADVWRFFGTSAAAPHAAAVAALQREAEPTASSSAVSQAQRDSAGDVGGLPAEDIGSGLVDAVGAIEALGVSPKAPGAEPESAPAPQGCFPTESEPGPEGEGPESEPEPEEGEPSGGAEDVGAQVAAANTSPVPIAAGSHRSTDRTAPQTFIKRRPRRVVRTRFRWGRAVFVFRTSQRGAVFICQFDRKRWRRCGPRFVRWFRPGRHVLRVTTRDGAGNVDPTPAVYRFWVRRIRR